MNDQPIDNRRKTVLVTGASGGIGRAICVHFAGAGWKVGVHYSTNAEGAAETVFLMGQRGSGPEVAERSKIYQADITLPSQVHHLVQNFVKDFDTLDTVVCNAGVAVSDLVIRQRVEDWERVIATNLTGTFRCLQVAGRAMVGSGGGSIIVIGSYAGIQGSAGQAAYAAAKAGLTGLVKTAAREWGPWNIRVNLVYPGWHPTALAGSAFPGAHSPAGRLLERGSNLEEVARTICHLAELSGVSGQIWNLDSRLL